MIRPDASLPMLEPSVDIVTYHANTSARVVGVVSCERTDLEKSWVLVSWLVEADWKGDRGRAVGVVCDGEVWEDNGSSQGTRRESEDLAPSC